MSASVMEDAYTFCLSHCRRWNHGYGESLAKMSEEHEKIMTASERSLQDTQKQT